MAHWLAYSWAYVSAYGCVHTVGAKSLGHSPDGVVVIETSRITAAKGGKGVATSRIVVVVFC